jgi:hypothetical protein
MAISLVVLMIPLALVVALFRLRGGEDVQVVNPSEAVASAQHAGLFKVGVPTGLPGGWRALSAQFTRNGNTGELRVGYLTPSDGQAQLIESNEDAAALSGRTFGGPARLTATPTVSGAPWQAYQLEGDRQALVLTDPGRTIIVVGLVKQGELEALAAAVS